MVAGPAIHYGPAALHHHLILRRGDDHLLFSWVFNYIFVLTRGGPGFSTYVSEYYIYQRAFAYDELGNASAFATIMLGVVLAGMFAYFAWLGRREPLEGRAPSL